MQHPLFRYMLMGGFLLTSQLLSAQSRVLQYRYDVTGNRIERKIVLSSGGGAVPDRKGTLQKDSLGKIGVSIFPNPTEGLIKITLDNYIEGVPAATITVYDLSGKLLIQKQGITGSTELDLSSFARGAYLLRLNAGENISVWNIVKE